MRGVGDEAALPGQGGAHPPQQLVEGCRQLGELVVPSRRRDLGVVVTSGDAGGGATHALHRRQRGAGQQPGADGGEGDRDDSPEDEPGTDALCSLGDLHARSHDNGPRTIGALDRDDEYSGLLQHRREIGVDDEVAPTIEIAEPFRGQHRRGAVRPPERRRDNPSVGTDDVGEGRRDARDTTGELRAVDRRAEGRPPWRRGVRRGRRASHRSSRSGRRRVGGRRTTPRRRSTPTTPKGRSARYGRGSTPDHPPGATRSR